MGLAMKRRMVSCSGFEKGRKSPNNKAVKPNEKDRSGSGSTVSSGLFYRFLCFW